ncbi:PAS domain-containing protein [Ancylobacter sp. MQZ15Z-1]|uniref:histidine kinase n=1 Tax=Ancylobacter mangrovi TaxID=2972472 RepID=A0A9X2PFM3_9HYPH|nr:PAS domain-containing protein [Ancylobacter mangrovi]MCS0495303.1 PAS domain-containing protein [Ancylobacter mangrovi]
MTLSTLVGLTVCWLTTTPFGLLAPLAGLCLYARGKALTLLNASLGTGIIFSAAVWGTHAKATLDVALMWTSMFAVALCIGAIVTSAATARADEGADGTASEHPNAATTPQVTDNHAIARSETTSSGPSLSLIHSEDRDLAAHAAARAFWTGVPQVVRYRQLHGDGSYRWIETRSEPDYSISVDIDDVVTDREPPAEPTSYCDLDVRQSAKVVESLFGNGWAFDAEGRWIYLHPFALNSLGVTLDDLNAALEEGHTAWKRLLHPDDYDQIAAAWRHCLQTGDHFNVEFRFRRANGAYVWARTAARPTRDRDGGIIGWFGIALDIDVYKKTVTALRNRERELSQLVDMVPSHLWRLTPDGEPTFFNRRMIDFLGLDVTDLEESDGSRLDAFMRTIHPDDAAGFKETLKRCLVAGAGFDQIYRLRRADGAYRWMSSRAEPLRDQAGRIVQWHGVCHDIDDQMKAEEALRQSQRQLQQLIDTVPVMIWSTTDKGTPTYLNKRYIDVTGITLEGLFAADGSPAPLAVTHPDDRAAATQVRTRAFETGGSYFVRYRQIRRDGSYRWTETRAEALRDDGGNILRWYGVAVDIDDMVTAQEKLRRSERELQQLIDALPIHIWSWTPDGKLAYVNKRYLEHLGLSQANFEDFAKVIRGLIHPDDSVAVELVAANCLKTGDPFTMRYRRRTPDGGYRWVEGRSEPLRDQDGTVVHWYHVSIDIDDAVRAQEELRLAYENLARQSQAASLAELSASIAHEVNQPLTAIVANSHACQRWLNGDTPNIERVQKIVERIIRDANSAADVVGRIRALFRQSTESRCRTSLESIVSKTRELLADEVLRRHVRLEVDSEEGLPPLTLDRVQIQQVLINLVRNGMDAMDTVGGDKVVGMQLRRAGDAIQIDIRDRGRGIAFPEKIFEPFFTTKEHGMGMGLAICRSIVESHGGRLWAENNEPRGAAFIFTLPIGPGATP